MPLVKVKEKFQVTIPTELREALHLAVGDILEATIENEYQAASRDFFADPRSFTCKYTYKVGSSPAGP